MNNNKNQLTLAHEARHQAMSQIAAIGHIIADPNTSPTAKIHTAHAISHLAQAAASLTRLRRALAHPGGTP